MIPKEQIKALKQEKKKMDEELDNLRGKTKGGKAICTLAFLGIFALCLGIFVGTIKLNAGNFASDVLAPIVADIPIVRSVLPSDLQQKTPAELQAEELAADQAATAAAAAQKAAAENTAAADQAAADQAAADQAAADQAAASQAAADQAAADQAAADQKKAAQQAADEAALADYVDTYSNMKPKAAAQVFENMMADQSDLVVKILSNITADKRAAILSNLSVTNASKITVLMEK